MTTATVLVVDDDRANLDSVARIFQREGLATLSASNGTEALDLLRKPEVSVMVTDLMMPGMDGQELLKAARTIRPDVEVVLMTAYATVRRSGAACAPALARRTCHAGGAGRASWWKPTHRMEKSRAPTPSSCGRREALTA